ncbi:MAG: TetR family transcriptional regulator [Pseudonocardiaceae bacterium]
MPQVYAELTEGGYLALSIGKITIRAGVTKTTVYRRWRQRGTTRRWSLLSVIASLSLHGGMHAPGNGGTGRQPRAVGGSAAGRGS